MVVTLSRSAATWPIMYMPRANCSSAETAARSAAVAVCNGGTVDALARDTQPAEVHALEGDADFQRRFPFGAELPFLALEHVGVRRRDAADGVAGTGLQQHRVAAPQRLLAGSGP